MEVYWRRWRLDGGEPALGVVAGRVAHEASGRVVLKEESPVESLYMGERLGRSTGRGPRGRARECATVQRRDREQGTTRGLDFQVERGEVRG